MRYKSYKGRTSLAALLTCILLVTSCALQQNSPERALKATYEAFEARDTAAFLRHLALDSVTTDAADQLYKEVQGHLGGNLLGSIAADFLAGSAKPILGKVLTSATQDYLRKEAASPRNEPPPPPDAEQPQGLPPYVPQELKDQLIKAALLPVQAYLSLLKDTKLKSVRREYVRPEEALLALNFEVPDQQRTATLQVRLRRQQGDWRVVAVPNLVNFIKQVKG